jgi:hypothetical protein
LTYSDEEINELLDSLYKRANNLEKSLLNLSIRTEGKISLQEIYAMPYLQREMYIKLTNEYYEEKNKQINSPT